MVCREFEFWSNKLDWRMLWNIQWMNLGVNLNAF